MDDHRQHPRQCEEATRDACECRHCAGTAHGWKGALDLAKRGDPAEIQRIVDSTTTRWRDEKAHYDRRPGKNKKPRLAYRKSCIDLALLDLINQLSITFSGNDNAGTSRGAGRPRGELPSPAGPEARPLPDTVQSGAHDAKPEPTPPPAAGETAPQHRSLSEAEQVEEIGNLLADVLKDVEGERGKLSHEMRKAMADHLWCDLLAQVCREIERSNELVGGVPDRITDWIMKSRTSAGFSSLERALVKSAAKHLWKRLEELLGMGVISRGRAVLPALRTLAIMACKRPAAHQAVVEHCVDPLKDQFLVQTKKKLLHALEDWLPRTREDFEREGARMLSSGDPIENS